MNLNPRKIPIGDIAYYVVHPYDQVNGVCGGYTTVDWALVVDHYTNAVVLQSMSLIRTALLMVCLKGS